MSAHFKFDDRSGVEAAEIFDLYLLEGLEAEERAEVEAHLASHCQVCQAALRAARTRSAAMALMTQPVEPGAEVKTRLMARLRAESAANRTRLGRVPANGGFPWAWLWGGATVVLGVLMLVFIGRSRGLELRGTQLQRQIAQAQQLLHDTLHQDAVLRAATAIVAAPATQVLEVKSQPAQPTGRAYLNQHLGAVLIAAGLPGAGPGKGYELWLLPAHGKPVAAGIFQSGATGAAVMTYSQPFEDVAGLAVTVEPAAGSQQPTSTPILVAQAGTR